MSASDEFAVVWEGEWPEGLKGPKVEAGGKVVYLAPSKAGSGYGALVVEVYSDGGIRVLQLARGGMQ